MTPEELLRDLRDIHLPQAPEAGFGFHLAFEPFLLLAGLLLVLALLALRRRWLWRLQARARLREIERGTGTADQWARLLELLRQVSRLKPPAPPPDCVYFPLDRVGPAELEALRHYLRAELRR